MVEKEFDRLENITFFFGLFDFEQKNELKQKWFFYFSYSVYSNS